MLSAIALAVLACPAPAAAQQRLISIDTPSANVDPSRVSFNSDGKLRANVLLPDGYDGRRRFPVLFLLHGVGDNYTSWAKPGLGDIRNTSAPSW